MLAHAAEDNGKNHFGLSARFGFNISASFNGVGDAPPQTDIDGPAGAADRTYDDGYVRRDSTYPENGGYTYYWGYQRSSQLAPAGAPTEILFHSAQPATTGGDEVDDAPYPGFEFSYGRDLGTLGKGTWGVEGAFGYMNVSIRDDRTLTGTATLTTDAYSLGTPPIDLSAYPPPYNGPFGPIPPGESAPAIFESPTRTVSSAAATIAGTRELDADLYSLRLGPYYRLPLWRRVSLQLGTGLAIVHVDSAFSYSEITSTTAGGPVSRSGSGSKDEFLFGVYVAGQCSVVLCKRVSAFLGAQFQHVGDFNQTVSSKQAQLDLSKSVFLTAGIDIHF
jgi:hypothetical protein